MEKLKLYVWPNYAPGYTPGLAFAVAPNVKRARELIAAFNLDKFGYTFDNSTEEDPKELDLNEIAYAQAGGS